MFDWFWKGLATIAGLAALAFGVTAKRRKNAAERERAERERAERDLIDAGLRNREQTRREWDAKAPPDPEVRKDFEGGV